jgi:DNA-binding CsgD family transcriptional regulator
MGGKSPSSMSPKAAIPPIARLPSPCRARILASWIASHDLGSVVYACQPRRFEGCRDDPVPSPSNMSVLTGRSPGGTSPNMAGPVPEDPTSELGLLVAVLRDAGYVLFEAATSPQSFGIARADRPDLLIGHIPRTPTDPDSEHVHDEAFRVLNAKLLVEVDELREAVVLAGLLHGRSGQTSEQLAVVDDGAVSPDARPSDVLSRRELEVLGLIAEGAANSEIAERLFIADTTVQSHVQHILRKLHARNRTEAAARFLLDLN